MTTFGPWMRLQQANARVALLEHHLMLRGAEIRGLRAALEAAGQHAADLDAQRRAQATRADELSRDLARARETLLALDRRLTALQAADERCNREHARLAWKERA